MRSSWMRPLALWICTVPRLMARARIPAAVADALSVKDFTVVPGLIFENPAAGVLAFVKVPGALEETPGLGDAIGAKRASSVALNVRGDRAFPGTWNANSVQFVHRVEHL